MIRYLYLFLNMLLLVESSVQAWNSKDVLETKDPYSAIRRHLSPTDKKTMRLVSHQVRDNEDELQKNQITYLENQVNSFNPSLSNAAASLCLNNLFYLEKHRSYFIERLKEKSRSQGYLFVIKGSPLTPILEKHFKRVDGMCLFEHLFEHEGLDRLIYESLFSDSLPNDMQSKKVDLRHLAACFPVKSIYFQKQDWWPLSFNKNVICAINNFWSDIYPKITHLTNQTYKRPNIELQNALAKREQLKIISHNVVLTDEELSKQNNIEGLSSLLSDNSEHIITLDVGNEFVTFFGRLDLNSRQLSRKIQFLRLTNAKNNVSCLGHDFLYYCSALRVLDCSELTNITDIGRYYNIGGTIWRVPYVPIYKFFAECSNLQKISFSDAAIAKLIFLNMEYNTRKRLGLLEGSPIIIPVSSKDLL